MRSWDSSQQMSGCTLCMTSLEISQFCLNVLMRFKFNFLSTVNSVDSMDHSCFAVNAPPHKQLHRSQRTQCTPIPLPHRSQTPAAPYHWSVSPSLWWYYAKFGSKALSCHGSLLLVGKLKHRQMDHFTCLYFLRLEKDLPTVPWCLLHILRLPPPAI